MNIFYTSRLSQPPPHLGSCVLTQFYWVLMAPLVEGVRRWGIIDMDAGSLVKDLQQTHLFSNGRALCTLLQAPRLLSDSLTLSGHSSLTRHDQYLGQSLLRAYFGLASFWGLVSLIFSLSFYISTIIALLRGCSSGVPTQIDLTHKLLPVIDYQPLKSIHSWRAPMVRGLGSSLLNFR